MLSQKAKFVTKSGIYQVDFNYNNSKNFFNTHK